MSIIATVGNIWLIYIFISNPSPIISKSCRCPRPNWKRPKKWHHCKLHYWLVCCGRHQTKKRPPRLDGSFFPPPYCAKHRRWMRVMARDKVLCKHCLMDEFLSGCKDGYRPWEYQGVSKTASDSFCDNENRYFLQLHGLLSSFSKLEHVSNVYDLKQREIWCVVRY